jgi:2-polyprenyl-6-methoxyphenol hydroxylase-like FAD-dependent oxidoreductase
MIAHKQPALEKCIRKVMAGYESCELRSGCKVISISEDDDFVYVTYEHSNGGKNSLKGKFLVGADGKTGFTRKRYLEPRGVKMEKVAK